MMELGDKSVSSSVFTNTPPLPLPSLLLALLCSLRSMIYGGTLRSLIYGGAYIAFYDLQHIAFRDISSTVPRFVRGALSSGVPVTLSALEHTCSA